MKKLFAFFTLFFVSSAVLAMESNNNALVVKPEFDPEDVMIACLNELMDRAEDKNKISNIILTGPNTGGKPTLMKDTNQVPVDTKNYVARLNQLMDKAEDKNKTSSIVLTGPNSGAKPTLMKDTNQVPATDKKNYIDRFNQLMDKADGADLTEPEKKFYLACVTEMQRRNNDLALIIQKYGLSDCAKNLEKSNKQLASIFKELDQQ